MAIIKMSTRTKSSLVSAVAQSTSNIPQWLLEGCSSFRVFRLQSHVNFCQHGRLHHQLSLSVSEVSETLPGRENDAEIKVTIFSNLIMEVSLVLLSETI